MTCRSKETYTCEKRPANTKKETYRRDLVLSNLKVICRSKETCMHEKRLVRLERNPTQKRIEAADWGNERMAVSLETAEMWHVDQKRPIHAKRDLRIQKETYRRDLRGRRHWLVLSSWDVTYRSKETYTCEKRPRQQETYRKESWNCRLMRWGRGYWLVFKQLGCDMYMQKQTCKRDPRERGSWLVSSIWNVTYRSKETYSCEKRPANKKAT